MTNKKETPENKASLSATFKSVGAAFIGVQSNENRKRDFAHGKLSHFIIVGIIAVIAFIGALIAVVSIVLN